MNEKTAREILGDAIRADDQLRSFWYAADLDSDGPDVSLDGWYTVRQLEAIVWWMKHKVQKKQGG